jgi:hypothetical protein
MEFTSDKAGLMKDGLPQHMVVWPYYAGVHVTAIKPTISGLYFVQIPPTNLYPIEIISGCDIVFISQVKNFPT